MIWKNEQLSFPADDLWSNVLDPAALSINLSDGTNSPTELETDTRKTVTLSTMPDCADLAHSAWPQPCDTRPENAEVDLNNSEIFVRKDPPQQHQQPDSDHITQPTSLQPQIAVETYTQQTEDTAIDAQWNLLGTPPNSAGRIDPTFFLDEFWANEYKG